MYSTSEKKIYIWPCKSVTEMWGAVPESFHVMAVFGFLHCHLTAVCEHFQYQHYEPTRDIDTRKTTQHGIGWLPINSVLWSDSGIRVKLDFNDFYFGFLLFEQNSFQWAQCRNQTATYQKQNMHLTWHVWKF